MEEASSSFGRLKADDDCLSYIKNIHTHKNIKTLLKYTIFWNRIAGILFTEGKKWLIPNQTHLGGNRTFSQGDTLHDALYYTYKEKKNYGSVFSIATK